MQHLFIRKIKIYIPLFEKYFDGYTAEEDGFPFGLISINQIWLIVNRFSGKLLPTGGFFKKKEAEEYFYFFSKNCNLLDIEFKDPFSEFDYAELVSQAHKDLDHVRYRIKNFG